MQTSESCISFSLMIPLLYAISFATARQLSDVTRIYKPLFLPNWIESGVSSRIRSKRPIRAMKVRPSLSASTRPSSYLLLVFSAWSEPNWPSWRSRYAKAKHWIPWLYIFLMCMLSSLLLSSPIVWTYPLSSTNWEQLAMTSSAKPLLRSRLSYPPVPVALPMTVDIRIFLAQVGFNRAKEPTPCFFCSYVTPEFNWCSKNLIKARSTVA